MNNAYAAIARGAVGAAGQPAAQRMKVEVLENNLLKQVNPDANKQICHQISTFSKALKLTKDQDQVDLAVPVDEETINLAWDWDAELPKEGFTMADAVKWLMKGRCAGNAHGRPILVDFGVGTDYLVGEFRPQGGDIIARQAREHILGVEDLVVEMALRNIEIMAEGTPEAPTIPGLCLVQANPRFCPDKYFRLHEPHTIKWDVDYGDATVKHTLDLQMRFAMVWFREDGTLYDDGEELVPDHVPAHYIPVLHMSVARLTNTGTLRCCIAPMNTAQTNRIVYKEFLRALWVASSGTAVLQALKGVPEDELREAIRYVVLGRIGSTILNAHPTLIQEIQAQYPIQFVQAVMHRRLNPVGNWRYLVPPGREHNDIIGRLPTMFAPHGGISSDDSIGNSPQAPMEDISEPWDGRDVDDFRQRHQVNAFEYLLDDNGYKDELPLQQDLPPQARHLPPMVDSIQGVHYSIDLDPVALDEVNYDVKIPDKPVVARMVVPLVKYTG